VLSSFYTFYFYPFCASFLFYFLRHPGARANDIHKKGTDRGKGVHFFLYTRLHAMRRAVLKRLVAFQMPPPVCASSVWMAASFYTDFVSSLHK
jgi:hypothetical protein